MSARWEYGLLPAAPRRTPAGRTEEALSTPPPVASAAQSRQGTLQPQVQGLSSSLLNAVGRPPGTGAPGTAAESLWGHAPHPRAQVATTSFSKTDPKDQRVQRPGRPPSRRVWLPQPTARLLGALAPAWAEPPASAPAPSCGIKSLSGQAWINTPNPAFRASRAGQGVMWEPTPAGTAGTGER